MMSLLNTDEYTSTRNNPYTDQSQRKWIEYADGMFEPVRRDGNLNDKYHGDRRKLDWWTVEKPVDWNPQDEGKRVTLNHDYREPGEDKKKPEIKPLGPGRSDQTVRTKEMWDNDKDKVTNQPMARSMTTLLRGADAYHEFEAERQAEKEAAKNAPAPEPSNRSAKNDDLDKAMVIADVGASTMSFLGSLIGAAGDGDAGESAQGAQPQVGEGSTITPAKDPAASQGSQSKDKDPRPSVHREEVKEQPGSGKSLDSRPKNSAQDTEQIRQWEKNTKNGIEAAEAITLLSEEPKTKEQADAWIDRFAQIDSSQLNEETKEKLMEKAALHFDQSGFMKQVGVKAMRGLTQKLLDWQGPVRDFFDMDPPEEQRFEHRRGHIGQRW